MEESVEEIAKHMRKWESKEQHSSLTELAIKIADIALGSFKGELLNKALAISKAVVDFDDELRKSGEK